MSLIQFTDYTVRKGDEGPHVKMVQCLVNKWRAKNNKAPIKEDSDAGPVFEREVKAFQRAHGLTGKQADGVIGPIGWELLGQYRTTINNPTPPPPQAVPPAMTIMVIDTTGKYAPLVKLWVKASVIALRLLCVYWRCNIEVIAGTFDDFDPDRHVALLLADNDGGVADSLGWHWAAWVQQVFRIVGVTNINDDDADPIGWVDMTSANSSRTFFHELYEMVVNHMVNFNARNYQDGHYWMLEVCDMVQRNWFAIWVDGQQVEISDVVGPDAFGNPGERAKYGMASDIVGPGVMVKDFQIGAYDLMGVLNRPWQIASGGYIPAVPINNPDAVVFKYGAGASEKNVNAHTVRHLDQKRKLAMRAQKEAIAA